MYGWLRPFLFRLPAETAHNLALSVSGTLGNAAQALIPRHPEMDDERLSISLRAASGRVLRFRHPVGLAAGVDKGATAFQAFFRLGFASVEIGTVTALAQPGNPVPRLFRLPEDQALLNRMGFNNEGSLAVAERLRQTAMPRSGVLGVNLGKTKVTAEEDAADDYAESARRLAPFADYVVVNVSSPNTPGLRSLQSADKLEPILKAVLAVTRTEMSAPLLFVKVAPDLLEDELSAVVDVARRLQLDGIVATNTTIRRDMLRTVDVASLGAGGISGAPLRERSREVLRHLAVEIRATRSRLHLISVGGIDSAEEAYLRIRGGASLVQVYSALVYQGPTLTNSICTGLLRLMQRDGVRRLQDVVGADL